MTSRLDIELHLRRHGGRSLLLLFALCVGAAIYLATQVAPAVPETVQPLDTNRQAEERHRAFRGILLAREMLAAGQRAALAEAERRGLAIGRIDYGFEQHDAGRFGIATLQLPVRGPYVDVRGFLAAVLAAQPALALEDLAIQRLEDGSNVEARLRLAFHVAPDGGGSR